MIRKLSLSWKLFFVFLISFILFFPSLSVFYTHDDFFLLKISKANSLGTFFNFFNFTQGTEGLGVYRPLTTQVFYFLSNSVFNLNPLPLHVISFITFFLVIYLVYKLVNKLVESDSVAFFAALLYATSATHYGHLYYLATYQELGLTVFCLLSVALFIKFVNTENIKHYFLSVATYILALFSKETAVVIPGILILTYGFLKLKKEKIISIKKFILVLSSFIIILLVYLYFHFFLYGLAQGESYIWDFSLRFINTLAWYGLWSFNLPEMLVDFVGPGLKFNPNLFKFWSKEIVSIFYAFGAAMTFIACLVLKVSKNLKKKDFRIIIFSLTWFILTLVPVLFLPLHKFTYYLTLPLIGVVLAISYLIEKAKAANSFRLAFAFIWVILSIFTLQLTTKTHWISQGSKVARNTYDYFARYEKTGESKKYIEFYDTSEDEELPWSPSDLVKVVLSQNNFFEVFFEDEFELMQEGIDKLEDNIVRVKARDLLNY